MRSNYMSQCLVPVLADFLWSRSRVYYCLATQETQETSLIRGRPVGRETMQTAQQKAVSHYYTYNHLLLNSDLHSADLLLRNRHTEKAPTTLGLEAEILTDEVRSLATLHDLVNRVSLTLLLGKESVDALGVIRRNGILLDEIVLLHNGFGDLSSARLGRNSPEGAWRCYSAGAGAACRS